MRAAHRSMQYLLMAENLPGKDERSVSVNLVGAASGHK